MNFKVKCVACSDKNIFTVGNIYEVTDGRFINEHGTLIDTWATQGKGQGIDALNYWYGSGVPGLQARFELVEESKMFPKDDIRSGDKIVTTYGKGIVVEFNGKRVIRYDGYKGRHDIVEYISSENIKTIIRPAADWQLRADDFWDGTVIFDREKGIGFEPKSKFRCGDFVKVIDSRECYSTYTNYLHKVAPQCEKYFLSGGAPREGTRYSVVAAHKHLRSDRNVYVIKDMNTTQVFIISEEGLEAAE